MGAHLKEGILSKSKSSSIFSLGAQTTMIKRFDGVEYITRKTMLNPSKIEWVERCCNHYVGCEHGCLFPCYARLISRRSLTDWTTPKVVLNALEIIEAEIPRLKKKGEDKEWILLSSMTDPYQPIESFQNLTQRIIRVFIREHMRFRILTKSDLVRRDLELLSNAKHVEVGLTIITLDDKQRKLWEPNASPIYARIQALHEASHNYGLPTFLSMEPIILGVTKPLEIIQELQAEVDFFIFGTHNYAPTKLRHHYIPLRAQIIKYCEEQGLKYLIKSELKEVQTKGASYQMTLEGVG